MAEAISPAPEAPLYDSNQKRMIDLLSTHRKYVMAGRTTDAQIESAAAALIDATTLMLRVGNNSVFDVMWEYHNDQKNGACQETRALKGFTRFSQVRSYSAALVYNAFRAVIQGIDWGSYNAALSKLPHGPALITYLENKKQ